MARKKSPSLVAVIAFIAGISAGVGLERSGTIDQLYATVFTGGQIELSEAEKQAGFVAVVRVVDGDTLIVDRDGREEKIRMLCINTPEQGKSYYDAATDSLRDLVSSGKVRLVYEQEGKQELDRYGRLLAYVFNDEGENVCLEQVRRGWSPYYDKFGAGRFPKDFAEAEKSAREQKIGLWR